VTIVLEAKDLTCGYGKIVAVRDIDFQVESGQVLAILGPNGAGKTTLMMTLAGLLPRIGGEVLLEGVKLPSGKPTHANRAGVVLVPDSRSLFTTLTVKENIDVARIRGADIVDDVIDLFPSLQRRLKLKAGALSGGEQQMLAMARGLVQKPKVFLVDEMSMGLAPLVVEALFEAVRRIAAEHGCAVVLVEQHVHVALGVADRAAVISHGDLVLDRDAASLRDRPEILEQAYFGSSEPAAS
jgi:branched-chain amino acid transport system ATP-binding protein